MSGMLYCKGDDGKWIPLGEVAELTFSAARDELEAEMLCSLGLPASIVHPEPNDCRYSSSIATIEAAFEYTPDVLKLLMGWYYESLEAWSEAYRLYPPMPWRTWIPFLRKLQADAEEGRRWRAYADLGGSN